MRVLVRTRLSRYSAEGTSAERQKLLIEDWARTNDHEIVGWAEDADDSELQSPFDSPDLGTWFKPPKDRQWDILCTWKLDQIARTSIGLHAVFARLQEQNKTLICISNDIDSSTWGGRLVAKAIAGVAEGDLAALTEDNIVARKTLGQNDSWMGGRPGYGYQSVKTEDGWRLERDPEEQRYLQEMIEGVLSGRSTESIAASLNTKEIPTARERRYGARTKGWTGDTVRQILKSKHILGWISHDSIPVLDAIGKPIPSGPPSITLDRWKLLQEALDNRNFKMSSRSTTSPLLGILECWHCHAPMHIRRSKTAAGTVHEGYHCKNGCKQKGVNGKQALELVHSAFQAELGDKKVSIEKNIPSLDITEELNDAKVAYENIAQFVSSAPSDRVRERLFSQLELARARILHLEETDIDDRVRLVETGGTYLELWEELDAEGKRQLMLKAGVKARIKAITGGSRHGFGTVEFDFIIPEDLHDRLTQIDNIHKV